MKNFTKRSISSISKKVIDTKIMSARAGRTPLIPNQSNAESAPQTTGMSIYNTKGQAQNIMGSFIKPSIVKK